MSVWLCTRLTVRIPTCCSFLSTDSVQCANYKVKDIFLNWRGKATSRSFAPLIGPSVTSNAPQTSPWSQEDTGCQAAKVEWGCEAGEFKEFSRLLTGQKPSPVQVYESMAEWGSFHLCCALLWYIASISTFTIGLYSLIARLQKTQTSEGVFMAPLWPGQMSLLYCTERGEIVLQKKGERG